MSHGEVRPVVLIGVARYWVLGHRHVLLPPPGACTCAISIYEGRSINKLQNGVILLIFRLSKFRNVHFVGDLILNTSWVLLRWRHCDVIYKHYIWQRWNHPTRNSLRFVQLVTSILQDQQYMFGVKSLFIVEKVLLMRKNLVAALFRRPMQRSQRSIPSCGHTGVWWDECLNEFGRYVDSWSLNVWRLNTFACWCCILFA